MFCVIAISFVVSPTGFCMIAICFVVPPIVFCMIAICFDWTAFVFCGTAISFILSFLWRRNVTFRLLSVLPIGI